MILFLKHVFHPIYEVFWQKNGETWKVGKIRKYDDEKLLFRGKIFQFFEKPSVQK